MRALILAALVPLLACAPSAPLAGSAAGKSETTTKPEPSKPKPQPPAPVVPLSGKATASGGME